jgi:hypothetical protein
MGAQLVTTIGFFKVMSRYPVDFTVTVTGYSPISAGEIASKVVPVNVEGVKLGAFHTYTTSVGVVIPPAVNTAGLFLPIAAGTL